MNYNDLEVAIAIDRLAPKSKYAIVNGDLQWQDESIECPTEQEILDEVEAIKAEKIANAYIPERKNAYPSLAEQLDMIWHELSTAGSLTVEGEWYNSIKNVKHKHPKT